MRAALRLLEEQEMRLAALRAAVIEGERSGPPEEFDFETLVRSNEEAGGNLDDG